MPFVASLSPAKQPGKCILAEVHYPADTLPGCRHGEACGSKAFLNLYLSLKTESVSARPGFSHRCLMQHQACSFCSRVPKL